MYKYTCIRTYVHIHIHIHTIYTCVRVSLCVCVCLSVLVCVCLAARRARVTYPNVENSDVNTRWQKDRTNISASASCKFPKSQCPSSLQWNVTIERTFEKGMPCKCSKSQACMNKFPRSKVSALVRSTYKVTKNRLWRISCKCSKSQTFQWAKETY